MEEEKRRKGQGKSDGQTHSRNMGATLYLTQDAAWTRLALQCKHKVTFFSKKKQDNNLKTAFV